MNNKLSLSLVVSAVFGAAGCNKSGKLDTPSHFQTSAGPVELKLKWPVGERVVQDFEMKQTTDLNIPGKHGPVKQTTTMGEKFALTVLKQDAAGGHELEMEFLSANMNVEIRGKTLMSYNSDKPSSADKTNTVASVFNKVLGSKIRFFLDASNNVERVEGVDELVDRL